MHKQRIRLGMSHQVFIHLIGPQHIMTALFGALPVMHAHPCVSDNKIRTLHSSLRIPLKAHAHTCFTGKADEFVFRVKLAWPRKDHIKAKLRRRMQE